MGSDILIGETGDDIYWVDSTRDKIIEYFNEGIATVNSSISYTLYYPDSGIDNITNFVVADDTISIEASNFGSGLTS